jgi:polyisoprenoid-binding protein YceI
MFASLIPTKMINKLLFLAVFCTVMSLTTSCKDEKPNNSTAATEAGKASEGAESYIVDTAGSVIEWAGSKQIAKHSGTIKLSGGNVFVNNNVLESGNFTIDMNSITVEDLKAGDGKEDLEAHLKGLNQEADADHFFNIKKYPVSRFEITKVSTENGKATVEGNLTIKETTKNIKFPATIVVNGNTILMVSDVFEIDRTLWKVNYGSKSVYSDLSDKFIEDNIELKVTLKASK